MCVGLQNLAKTQTGQLEIPPDLNGTVVELLWNCCGTVVYCGPWHPK